MSFVEIHGRRLACTRQGRGEPLLLIQGMGVHHRMWGSEFLDALARRFEVVVFDHRGIGASDRADSPFTIADLAADTAGLIRELGWASAHVFGISMGGMVAQELTLRYPELVRTLTIGCSWAGGPDGIMSETANRVVAAMATKNVDHSLRTGFEANFSARFTGDPAAFERYASLSLAVRVPVPVVLMQWEAAQRHDTSNRLSAVTVPTMIVHGTADAMLSVVNGKHIAGLIPGSRLELLPDAGHLFWWEEPRRTVDLLEEHAR